MKLKPTKAKKPAVKKQRTPKKQNKKEVTLVDPWDAAAALDEVSYKLAQAKGLANVLAGQDSIFSSNDEKEALWLLHDLIEKIKEDLHTLEKKYRQMHFDNNSIRFENDDAWPEDQEIEF